MPSKRKQKTREDKLFQDGWFELSDDMWLEPGEKPKKVRLVADANFPYQLVEVLREQKIEVKTAQELGLHRLADEELLRRVLELGYALITMDGDFWSDAKFPLTGPGGIIFVEGSDQRIGETEGFGLLVLFLLAFGGGWRKGKFKASSTGMVMKINGHEGKKVIYEFRGFRPLVYAREVNNPV